ncbi:MAG: hypothetical protein ACYTGX_15105 [Planctomycetota bacterium]|jgi:hypothetical protein
MGGEYNEYLEEVQQAQNVAAANLRAGKMKRRAAPRRPPRRPCNKPRSTTCWRRPARRW